MQNNLQENQLNISALVNEQSGHIYVCGDVRMAEDVKNLLDKILLYDENGNRSSSMTQKSNSDAVENHQNEYKFPTDLLKVIYVVGANWVFGKTEDYGILIVKKKKTQFLAQ